VEVVNPNAAPVEAPKEIKPEVPQDTNFDRALGVEGGVPGGVPGGVVGGLPDAPPPPPPPPPPAQPVRVGGQIKAPTQIKKVPPTYPQIAQSARVSGVVILEATIGVNGKVQDVKVLRSVPLLDQAAIDAVRQWEYTPTLLNNVPTAVIMTVTVTFTLN
jgi:protein TonB